MFVFCKIVFSRALNIIKESSRLSQLTKDYNNCYSKFSMSLFKEECVVYIIQKCDDLSLIVKFGNDNIHIMQNLKSRNTSLLYL